VRSRVDGPLVAVPFQEGQLVAAVLCSRRSIRAPFRWHWTRLRGNSRTTSRSWRMRGSIWTATTGCWRKTLLRSNRSIRRSTWSSSWKAPCDPTRPQVENARLQLEFTSITAPFPGRVGLRQIDTGKKKPAVDARRRRERFGRAAHPRGRCGARAARNKPAAGACAPTRHGDGDVNPSALFIERPVATWLVMVSILLSGLIGYHILSVSALPEVDYPTIQVQTLYPGASPDVTTSSITAPLERQFGQMPGLSQMSSASSGGASVIILQFSLTYRSTRLNRRSRPRSTPRALFCLSTCRCRRSTARSIRPIRRL